MAHGDRRDEQGELAGAVWIAAVVYCAALSAVGMAVTIAAAAHSDESSLNAWWLVFGVLLIGLAAAFGFVVGAILGIPIGLLVTFGHRRFGVLGVSILIPLVLLVVTEAILLATVGLRAPAALVVSAILALGGGLMIDHRYQKAARKHPVH